MTNFPDVDSLDVSSVFPENNTPASPIKILKISELTALPMPNSQIEIPLRKHKNPPKLVIADDEEPVIAALQRSLKAQYKDAMDVRFWRPSGSAERGLLETIKQWVKEGWRPDAVVIDINFDDGGKHGVHYLEELRNKPGCAALAVALATGNQYSDLDQGRLSLGMKNKTAETPTEWLRKAKRLAPEAILYGKSADASFLGRIGEHLDDWKRAARRRAWISLLEQVAELLDGRMVNVELVAQKIVDFAVDELGADESFVRRCLSGDIYELLASNRTEDLQHIAVTTQLDINKVPLLRKIVDKNREPVIRENITVEDAGIDYRDSLKDRHFIGVGAELGERTVGLISLLRKPDRPPFDEEIDGPHLKVLARLLASALRILMIQERQARVLEFSNCIALSSTFSEVCRQLADTVQKELHDADNVHSKLTVRLLDFGTGQLKLKASLGRKPGDCDIHINNPNSVLAQVVRENYPIRVANVKSLGDNYLNCDPDIKSELCVPLSIGKYALGAVNMEHTKEDYYTSYDQGFVSAAATLAANAIERIRTARVLEGMTDFVHRFPREKTGQLDRRLRTLLYQFCGYSVLVDLEREDNPFHLWKVRHLECKYKEGDEQRLKQEMDSIYANKWTETWIGKLHKERLDSPNAWLDKWAEFNDDTDNFFKVNLTPTQDTPIYQQGDAVLWLRHGGDAPPHRALLLMWFLPPPMGLEDIKLLGRIARLFSELDTRRKQMDDMLQKYVIGEQAAQIGHVMQHFRHRLGSLTGGQETHIDVLESAYRSGDKSDFEKALNALRENAKDIAQAFHKSRGYVKAVEITPVLIQEVVDLAKIDLATRLNGVSVSENIPHGIKAKADRDIAALVLYSLLENALDATEGQAYRHISISALQRNGAVCLQVADNGPGVPENNRQELFRWGKTTKTHGLGSALAFGLTRMGLINGTLEFPLPQQDTGALFEICFPKMARQEELK